MSKDLRRAEFAVAAFGVTAFLLGLVFLLDTVRFHRDVLVSGSAEGVLLVGLALLDVCLLVRGGISPFRYLDYYTALATVRGAGAGKRQAVAFDVDPEGKRRVLDAVP